MGGWDEHEPPRDPANGQFVESWVAALRYRVTGDTESGWGVRIVSVEVVQ